MNIKAIIHEDETGGYWAEVPALPGCATQGDTMDELLFNLREAIEGVLTGDIEAQLDPLKDKVLEIALGGRYRAESSLGSQSGEDGGC
jgi:predicted RNase H-like HicB family nuclease